MSANFKSIIKYLKENPGPGFNKITEITTNILMSDFDNSCDIEILKSYGIRTILDVSNIERDPELIKQFDKKRINYVAINTPTNFDVLSIEKFANYINTGYDIIHASVTKNNKILVHCIDGVNISAVFVIYYLLKRYYLCNFLINIDSTRKIADPDHYFLLDIIKFIKDRRLCIEPDASLIMQLTRIESAIKDYHRSILQIAADENKITKLKTKLEKDEFDPYDDAEEPADIMDYLDEKYGKIETKKIEKQYDKLDDLLFLQKN
jgi:hypothetical protein